MDPYQKPSLSLSSSNIFRNPDDGYLFLEQPIDEIEKVSKKVKEYLISTHFKNHHVYVKKIDHDTFKIKVKDMKSNSLAFDFRKTCSNEISSIKLHQEAMFLVQRHAK